MRRKDSAASDHGRKQDGCRNIESEHRKRQGNGGRQGGERDDAASAVHQKKHCHRSEHGGRRENEKDSRCRRDPLATPKTREDREDVTKNSAETDHGGGRVAQSGRGREVGRNYPLAQVEQQCQQPQPCTDHARDIRRSDVAAATGANVDTLRPTEK